MSIKDEITEIINSNEAEGVLDVNNYFNNSEYEIKDAEIIIEMKNGKIVNISITTKISYVSTGGEYSGEKVLLTNSIELAVNEKIDDAYINELYKTIKSRYKLETIEGGLPAISIWFLAIIAIVWALLIGFFVISMIKKHKNTVE